MTRVSRFYLLVVLILLSGCTGGRSYLEAPRSRADINRALSSYPAEILLKNGERFEHVRRASMGANSVQFFNRRYRDIPLSEVARISVEVNQGREKGSALGMVPGLLAMAAGGFVLATYDRDSWALPGAAALTAGGFVGMMLGGVLGSEAGAIANQKRTFILYESGS